MAMEASHRWLLLVAVVVMGALVFVAGGGTTSLPNITFNSENTGASNEPTSEPAVPTSPADSASKAIAPQPSATDSVKGVPSSPPQPQETMSPPEAPLTPPSSDWPKTVVHNFHKMPFEEYWSRFNSKAAFNEPALCELAVLYSDNCFIERGKETFMGCIDRIGAQRLATVLPSKCVNTKFFQELIEKEKSEETKEKAAQRKAQPLRYGRIEYSQAKSIKQAYVPPSERPNPKFAPPRVCKNGCKHYPISFSIPKRMLVERPSRLKLFDFLPYSPNTFPNGHRNQAQRYAFGSQDEWASHTLHRHSMFAYTHKRGGWDCMRHLEILAAGAIPYMPDIDRLPRNTMSTYPRELIKEAMALDGVSHIGKLGPGGLTNNQYLTFNGRWVNFKAVGKVNGFNTTQFDKEKYFQIADKIHEHVKQSMTSEALMTYVLRMAQYEEPKNVLVVGRWIAMDFMTAAMISGLSDLGIPVTSVGGFEFSTEMFDPNSTSRTDNHGGDPAATPDYSGATTSALEGYRKGLIDKYGPIHGWGWMYGFRWHRDLVTTSHASPTDPAIRKQILDGVYDLVIYIQIRNGPVARWPYWSAVSQKIPKERRILVDFHDDDGRDPDQSIMDACNYGHVFRREMHDTEC